MICSVCKRDILLATTYNCMYYCAPCYIKKFPPVLTLAVLWDSPRSFFNPKTKSFELISLKQLELCGFELFRHTIFNSSNANTDYKELLLFRYKSIIKCERIVDYSWPAGTSICLNNKC